MYTEICAELGVVIAVASNAPYIQAIFILCLLLEVQISGDDQKPVLSYYDGKSDC